MKTIKSLFALFFLLVASFITSCSSTSDPELTADEKYSVEDILQWDKNQPEYTNPFDEGTYKHFIARQDYPVTYDTWKDPELLKLANGKNSKIVIKINGQRGKFYVNKEMAIDFPISTGVASFPTKKGNYKIISKRENHRSNLYGIIYDENSKIVNGDADTTKDVVPEGGRFEGASMPYFMRLTNAGLGLHVGKVRRKPCSHGCIRTPRDVCSTIFNKVTVGTSVDVID